MPAVCTYDNPATMARECWLDGELICQYDSNLFFLKDWPVPPQQFFFGANTGDWKTGQLVGDKEALPVAEQLSLENYVRC